MTTVIDDVWDWEAYKQARRQKQQEYETALATLPVRTAIYCRMHGASFLYEYRQPLGGIAAYVSCAPTRAEADAEVCDAMKRFAKQDKYAARARKKREEERELRRHAGNFVLHE